MKYIFLVVILSCGKKNIAECTDTSSAICSERTPDENARLALEQKDYATAAQILEDLVSKEPTVYSRFPLLAAAYAAQSGFDIFKAAQKTSDSSSLLATVRTFIPTPGSVSDADYKTALQTMKKSVDKLKSIPAASRLATSSDKYAASAVLQLTLYESAYSIMYLSQFAFSAANPNTVDVSKLSTMTESDAKTIIDSLADAGASFGGQSGQQLKTSIDSALATINSQPGATLKDKVSAYVQAQNKP